MTKKYFLFLISGILSLPEVFAHCPLCTIGAGAAAGAAVWLGVSKIVVALFIGAFAMSMGLWFSRIPKKNYIPFQKIAIVSIIFLTTFLPLIPIFRTIGPLYISFIGQYGTTYAFDYALISGIFGGFVVFVSPFLSKGLSKFRNGKIIPFQGVTITLSLLIVTGGIIQLIV